MHSYFSTLAGLGLLLCSATSALSVPKAKQEQTLLHSATTKKDFCPLAPKVAAPKNDGLYSPLRFVKDDFYRFQEVERLSRAVQVPTQVGDYWTDPYEPGFSTFLEFHTVLESLFPLMYVLNLLAPQNSFDLLAGVHILNTRTLDTPKHASSMSTGWDSCSLSMGATSR